MLGYTPRAVWNIVFSSMRILPFVSCLSSLFWKFHTANFIAVNLKTRLSATLVVCCDKEANDATTDT